MIQRDVNGQYEAGVNGVSTTYFVQGETVLHMEEGRGGETRTSIRDVYRKRPK